MSFLDAWNKALREAVRAGEPGRVWKIENGVARCVGRTCHPAFMGLQPVKHDPERDGEAQG